MTSPASIPYKYQQMLQSAGFATLSTLSPDGSIQSTLVWPDYEDGLIRLSMPDYSAKLKNMRRQGRATLLAVDPENEDYYVSIRCELIDVTAEGAIEHLDMLTRRNMNLDHWYGDVVDADDADQEHHVVVLLRPVRVYST